MIRALVAIALLAGTAHAGGAAPPVPASKPPAEPEPDPAAREAAEGANLESNASRDGLVVTLSGGAGITIGIRMNDATGQGSANTLRIAHAATPRTMLTFEVVYNTLLFLPDGDNLYTMHSFSTLAGAQYYVNPALWVRGAGGVGIFVGEEFEGSDFELRPAVERWGPAASGGFGLDILRLKSFRLSIEYSATAMYNRDGVLLSNALLVGAGFD